MVVGSASTVSFSLLHHLARNIVLLATGLLLTFPVLGHTADVIYGHKAGMALTLDVFTPAQKNGAGVIFLVSGGWASSCDDPTMVHVAVENDETYQRRGYTVFAVVHGSMPRFNVPDVILDVQCAVRFIRHNAAEFGVDPNRFGVLGSGTGLGREIALEFARQSVDVVLHYSHKETGALTARDEIRAMGRRCEVFRADFDNVERAIQLGDRAIGSLGDIDCLVNNSGICLNKPFFEVKPEWFDLLLHFNVRAQFFLTQRIARDMVEHDGGTVVNISSVHGVSRATEHSIYAGTKGAIIAYPRALAVEIAHPGVRVNAIAPGWVTVESYYTALPGFNEEDARKVAAEKVPLGRSVDKLEIAQLAVFLCSNESGYIVGPNHHRGRRHDLVDVADLGFSHQVHSKVRPNMFQGISACAYRRLQHALCDAEFQLDMNHGSDGSDRHT
jgi:NAD(P)-dependent dehydrogenase (short-subunit alcohol dehydrogenase family)